MGLLQNESIAAAPISVEKQYTCHKLSAKTL
jgi:hypothetical protein